MKNALDMVKIKEIELANCAAHIVTINENINENINPSVNGSISENINDNLNYTINDNVIGNINDKLNANINCQDMNSFLFNDNEFSEDSDFSNDFILREEKFEDINMNLQMNMNSLFKRNKEKNIIQIDVDTQTLCCESRNEPKNEIKTPQIKEEPQLELEATSSDKKKKQYKCSRENCNKIYKSRENLTLHIKNIHDRIKPYHCRFCHCKFSHRNGKTYHERKFHINYLPYKCSSEECNFSFASKSAMNAHFSSKHLKQKRKRKSNKQINSKLKSVKIDHE